MEIVIPAWAANALLVLLIIYGAAALVAKVLEVWLYRMFQKNPDTIKYLINKAMEADNEQ